MTPDRQIVLRWQHAGPLAILVYRVDNLFLIELEGSGVRGSVEASRNTEGAGMVVEARARLVLHEAGHAVCDPQICEPWQWPFLNPRP
jgi:hypothetical protein